MKGELRRHFVVPLLIVLFTIRASAALYSGSASLSQKIDAALSDQALAHGIQGVMVQSLTDGRILYQRNADMVFLPASNFKLIVSATALDVLGPKYTFQTNLYAFGEQTAEGTLEGDLILVGGGDPVLSHEHLEAMAKKLRAAGVRAVTGDVIGDDSAFDEVRLGKGWSWDYESYYYAAQISGLNLNRNVVDVWVRPGRRAGAPALVQLTPSTGYMTVRNECTTSAVGTKSTVSVDRLRGKNVIRVRGNVPLDYKPTSAEEAITVEEPTLYACRTMIEIMERQGIGVGGQARRGSLPKGARLIESHHSVPLSRMLELMNKPSDNLIAECLLKALGAVVNGRGTADSGQEVELEFLKRAGADITAVSISDGSGLSRLNYISPANLVSILRYMHGHEHSKVFADSLPIAGVDGTLKSRLRNTCAEGKVRAKTGYLSRVRALSGYAATKSGDTLAFSILMNGHLCEPAKAAEVQDRIVEAMCSWDGRD